MKFYTLKKLNRQVRANSAISIIKMIQMNELLSENLTVAATLIHDESFWREACIEKFHVVPFLLSKKCCGRYYFENLLRNNLSSYLSNEEGIKNIYRLVR